MRIKQYVKNSFVFIPLFFSLRFTELYYWERSLVAFFSFCVLSSGIYILNDIIDRKRDAMHPIKKQRVIASGKMKLPAAIGFMAVLLLVFAASALYLNLACFLVGLIYIAVNISYSFYLKHVPILDVLCIAMGFVLRVIMGSYAVVSYTAGVVPLSQWLLLMIISVSFFLGFGKRRSELLQVGSENGTRDVLSKYSSGFLDQAMTSMMTLSIILYAFWTMDPQITERFGGNLIYTTILIIIILLRYSYVLRSPKSREDPTTVLLEDKPLILLFLLYGSSLIFLLYLNHTL